MSRSKRNKLVELNKNEKEQIVLKLGFLFLIIVVIRIVFLDYKYFSFGIIPFFLGLIYKSFSISNNYKDLKEYFISSAIITVYSTLSLIVFSILFIFISTKSNRFEILDIYAFFFPYIFCVFFILVVIASNWKVINLSITEGITLIQTLSFIYFCLDSNLLNDIGFFEYIMIGISSIMILISLVSAFTNIQISKNLRLLLSLWSAFIVIFFAYFHIRNLLNDHRVITYNINSIFFITLNYFLLGISIIYIAYNLIILTNYLPDKNATLLSKEHIKQIRETNKIHYDRFSSLQVNIVDSMICLIFCLILFLTNYLFGFMPKQTAIWLAFLIIPIMISLKNKVIFFKKASKDEIKQ